MSSNIPGPGTPPAGAAAPQNIDVTGLDGQMAALKVAIKTGAKAANREADYTIIDTYAGIKDLLSKDAAASVAAKMEEEQFVRAVAKELTGKSPNLKAAATQLRAQFLRVCVAAHGEPSANNFAAFSSDMRTQLADKGVSAETLDAVFGQASSTEQSFSVSSTAARSRGNV